MKKTTRKIVCAIMLIVGSSMLTSGVKKIVEGLKMED